MLTKSQIDTIVNNDQLVIRNLQITQGYYRLAQGMRKMVSRKNVSWVGFATHASKTAGQALRHELMPRAVKSAMIRMAGYENTYNYLDGALGEEKMSDADNRLGDALKKVSLLVSEGNVTVFAELAWPFADFINTFRRDWDRDEAKFNDFLNRHLKPGPLEMGGQDHLFEAFTAYYNARFESNSKRKAEYVFQGNLLIGLHEQTRLTAADRTITLHANRDVPVRR